HVADVAAPEYRRRIEHEIVELVPRAAVVLAAEEINAGVRAYAKDASVRRRRDRIEGLWRSKRPIPPLCGEIVSPNGLRLCVHDQMRRRHCNDISRMRGEPTDDVLRAHGRHRIGDALELAPV